MNILACYLPVCRHKRITAVCGLLFISEEAATLSTTTAGRKGKVVERLKLGWK
jgi:hypothetical protein